MKKFLFYVYAILLFAGSVAGQVTDWQVNFGQLPGIPFPTLDSAGIELTTPGWNSQTAYIFKVRNQGTGYALAVKESFEIIFQGGTEVKGFYFRSKAGANSQNIIFSLGLDDINGIIWSSGVDLYKTDEWTEKHVDFLPSYPELSELTRVYKLLYSYTTSAEYIFDYLEIETSSGRIPIDNYGEPLGIDDPPAHPGEFSLSQNYPNPFNPKTAISYQLSVISEVELSIYNMLGQKVAMLVSGRQPAGAYKVEWDATGFASGVYFYRLRTGDREVTKKMILMK